MARTLLYPCETLFPEQIGFAFRLSIYSMAWQVYRQIASPDWWSSQGDRDNEADSTGWTCKPKFST